MIAKDEGYLAMFITSKADSSHNSYVGQSATWTTDRLSSGMPLHPVSVAVLTNPRDREKRRKKNIHGTRSPPLSRGNRFVCVHRFIILL